MAKCRENDNARSVFVLKPKSFIGLQQKITSQLECDIIRLFQTSIHYDIEIVVDNESLFGHSCILKARASQFFTFITTECVVEERNILKTITIENASLVYIRKFLENIYSSAFIPEAESYVLKYLENVKKSISLSQNFCGDQLYYTNLLSPESETFFTPKSSPSEFYKPFSLLNPTEEEECLSRSRNNANVWSYYRIVSVDENHTDEKVAPPDFERELEEQDELFESLRSIGVKKKNYCKPNSLNFVRDNKSSAKSSNKSHLKKVPAWKPKLVENDAKRLKKSHKNDYKICNQSYSSSQLLQKITITPKPESQNLASKIELNAESPMELSHRELSVSDSSINFATEVAIHDVQAAGTQPGMYVGENHEVDVERMDENVSVDLGSVRVGLENNDNLQFCDLARLDEMEKNMTGCEMFLDMERRASSNSSPSHKCSTQIKETEESKKTTDVVEDSIGKEHTDENSDPKEVECEIEIFDDSESVALSLNCDLNMHTPPCSPRVIAMDTDATSFSAKPIQAWEPVVSSNFFIDASSLLDEDEINSPPMSLPPMKLSEIRVVEQELISVEHEGSTEADSMERRKGELIFKNSIPHYSKHDLDGPPTERLRGGFDHGGEEGAEQVVPVSYSSDLLHFVNDCFTINDAGDSSLLLSQSLPASGLDQLEGKYSQSCSQIETQSLIYRPQESVARPIEANTRKISAENLPIVSGGVSPKDYSSSPHSHSSSPHLRRRHEQAPILSGGMDAIVEPLPRPERKSQPNGQVWVVDVGSSTKKPGTKLMRGTSSESECEDVSREKPKERALPIPRAVQNLREEESSISVKTEEENRSSIPIEKSASLGYFIDFGGSSEAPKVVAPKKLKNNSDNVKKNIFSMFIDLDDPAAKKEPGPNKQPDVEKVEDECGSGSSSVSSHTNPKPFFMFIESESPVGKRKSTSVASSLLMKRSVTEKKAKSSDGRKISDPLSRTTNSSIEENSKVLFPSETRVSKSTVSTKSVDVWSKENGKRPVEDFCVQPNDNPDISLKKGSTFIIDGSTDNNNKKTKEMHSDLHTVLESTPPKSPFKSPKSEERDSGVVATEESDDSFVRLSDMDSTGKNPYMEAPKQKRQYSRMSQSIPEDSWLERKPSRIPEREKIMSKSVIVNAGKNVGTEKGVSKSLSRLFPNLSASTLSLVRSGGHGRVDTELENEASQASELSSMYSSMDPYGLEISTSETDVSCHQDGASRLGQDLLRMFLDEISPDVVVEVGGRRLKAHKCILSSRCQYFAAILSGGWVESAGNVISLQGFSYGAVHFALCHIYSGESEIPDALNIIELATLADMLCLEGLKEVISYTLRVKYCHSFHAPCSGCCVGVLDCLPLAAAYGLDDLYRKCLRWTAKYFVKVWPSKGFASLPKEILDKCFQYHVVHMTVDNVLDTLLGIDKIRGSLPSIRWAETVLRLVGKLQDYITKFLADHFSSILTCDSFLALGKDSEWSIERVESSMLEATGRMPPEQACWSHARLHSILSVATSSNPPPEMVWNENFIMLLGTLSGHVQANLIKQAPRAARSKAWHQMEPELRSRIQEAACLVLPPDLPHVPRRSASKKDIPSTNTFARSSSRAADLRQVKLTMTQQASRSVATVRRQQQLADKSIRNEPVKHTVPPAQRIEIRKSQSTSAVRENFKAQKGPGRFTEVKSRYLEQRSPHKTVQEKQPPTILRRNGRGLSSTDSSRNCSPGMNRVNQMKGPASLNRKSAGTDISSSATTRSETPSIKGLGHLAVDDNMSTDSLATESSCGEKEPRPTRRFIRGKENVIDKKIPSKITPNLPRKTQSLSSFPSTGNQQGKMKTMIPRMEIDTKSSSARRVQPSRGSLASPRASPRPSPRVADNAKASKNVNVINGNVNYKKRTVDAENNSTTVACSQPPIVSRSGTFLKDEPTILKKPLPQSDNV